MDSRSQSDSQSILQVNKQLQLDPYEIPSKNHIGHWKLKSGYTGTLTRLKQEKKSSGHTLGLKFLEDLAQRYNLKPNNVLFKINKAGYKGPPLVSRKETFRILTLGNSCTFGTYLDRLSYPRVLEKSLTASANISNAKPVEVINGGVQGYSPRNLLFRFDDYKQLKPNIATIYIGWNALWSDKSAVEPLRSTDWSEYIKTIEVLQKIYRRLKIKIVGKQHLARQQLQRKKTPVRNPEELRKLDNYHPGYLKKISRLIDKLQKINTEVVLLTLPGLYTLDSKISDQAVKLGHLPSYTNNPYVLAKLTEELNQRLRDLAVKKNIKLIDLAKWSKETLNPRHKYFRDSIHLTVKGESLLGKKLADELISQTVSQ